MGLALGDALGAPYEGGPLERLLWRTIGRTRQGKMRWTDDTQMALDLAESLILQGRVDADDLAQRFASSYRWSRGYGPGTAKVLRQIRRGASWQDAVRAGHRNGSLGNGGAMRAPIVGLFFVNSTERLVAAASATAQVTHAHPLGVEGAVLIAAAVAMATQTSDPQQIMARSMGHSQHAAFSQKLRVAKDWLAQRQAVDPREVAKTLGNGMTASASCVTSIYIALRFLDQPFVAAMDFVRRCGGDVDTIGAMCGAVWGATRGIDALPADKVSQIEQQERLLRTAGALWEHHPAPPPGP